MDFSIQPILQNENIILFPLEEKDFDDLYAVASDPAIWEQHPEKDRWKRDVFRVFFDLAMQSKGAFRIVDKTTGNTIGSTRIYHYDSQENSLFIGYTFYAVSCWGKGVNRAVKTLMLDYLFRFVSKVYFHIGAGNTRSQIAIDRIGAQKIAEEVVTYQDGSTRLNFLYAIEKKDYPLQTGQQVTIRMAAPGDIKTIQLIGRQTFFETFAQSNTESDMEKYLEESFSDEKTGAELNDPDSFFFIASENGAAIGYLKLNTGKAQTELQDEAALEIERIYVKSSYHGKKVGQLLYEKALETGRLLQKSYIWLAVWEQNPRAIRFYRKNGFIEFGKHIFRLGDDEQTDIMMKLELASE